MNPDSKLRLSRLLDLQHSEAQRQLTDAELAHRSHTQQAAQLQAFVREYELRLQASGGAGMPAAQLLDYRLFLARLSAAITEQEHVVAVSEEQRDVRRQAWLEQTQRRRALDDYTSRLRRAALLQQERRVQQQLDDRRENTVREDPG